MLRLIVNIIIYTLRYDHYNTPEVQSTVSYGDRLKRTTTRLHKINEYGPRDIDNYPITMIFSPA